MTGNFKLTPSSTLSSLGRIDRSEPASQTATRDQSPPSQGPTAPPPILRQSRYAPRHAEVLLRQQAASFEPRSSGHRVQIDEERNQTHEIPRSPGRERQRETPDSALQRASAEVAHAQRTISDERELLVSLLMSDSSGTQTPVDMSALTAAFQALAEANEAANQAVINSRNVVHTAAALVTNHPRLAGAVAKTASAAVKVAAEAAQAATAVAQAALSQPQRDREMAFTAAGQAISTGTKNLESAKNALHRVHRVAGDIPRAARQAVLPVALEAQEAVEAATRAINSALRASCTAQDGVANPDA